MSDNNRWSSASPAAANDPDADNFGFTGETRAYMKKLLRMFRQHLNGTRVLADSSQGVAMGVINMFLKHVRKPIWEWQHADVTNFIDNKRKEVENLSVSTQSLYFTYLRSLQNWLFTDRGLRQEIFTKFGVQVQEWIDSRNAIPIRNKGRKRKKPKHALDASEFEHLMREFDASIELAFRAGSKSAYPLARDKVITAVIYEYGLRVAEVLRVRSDHFHEDRRHPIFKRYAILRVFGKGGVTGTPHALDPQIVPLLDWYEEHIRPHFQSDETTDNGLYFYSERGGALTDEQIRRRLLQMGRRAGLLKRLHPHVLRRSHGTDSMHLLGPVGAQHQLRHADIRTTFDYYTPDPNAAGRSIARAVGRVSDARASKPPKEPE